MKLKLLNEYENLYVHMDSIFGNAIGNTFWKDPLGKYLGANNNELQLLGLSDFDDLLGKPDSEFVSKPNARVYMKNNQMVMDSCKGILCIEPFGKGLKAESYISYKAPFLNSRGKVIGTFGISYALKEACIIKNSYLERILHEITLFAGPDVEILFRETIRNYKKTQLGLSHRQLECLELLAKGMTYVQIAENLALSKRTIEHYIEAIKVKLDCNNRYDLISKFIESGIN